MTETAKPKRVAKARLDRRAELLAEADKLAKQAKALNEEAAAIEAEALADLKASGKPAIMRGGYRLEWTAGRVSIAWKSELAKRVTAEVIQEITAGQTPRQVLRITPPATAPVNA